MRAFPDRPDVLVRPPSRPRVVGAALCAVLAVSWTSTTARPDGRSGPAPHAEATAGPVAAGHQEAGPLATAGRDGAVHVVPVTGTVELGLAPFVGRTLEEAAVAGAGAVVLDLDTPGGRIDAAWEIIDAVRDAGVPVIAYVNRRALSAGAMIALSADRLYMRPGSALGAATPVTGEGQRASEKMVSAMRSEFRALAEERGFDPRIAEAMVDETVEVEGVVDAGRLLTLTTDEAVELGVATGRVADLPALFETLGLAPDIPVVRPAPNWAERAVRFLTNPVVAPLLLSIGFLGMLIEIKTPTFGLAGGLGLVCLTAFFGARYLVNLAGLEELLLVGGGIVLIVIEVFVVPGFGVAGGLGAAALLAGTFMSLLGAFPTPSDLMGAAGIIASAILILVALAWAILRHLPYSRSITGIFLRSETSRETGYVSAQVREELVGAAGVALTDLRPSGTARIGGERVDVVTEGPWIEEGTPVVVLRAEGYRHVVREAEEDEMRRLQEGSREAGTR